MAPDAVGPPGHPWKHERDAQRLPDPRQPRTSVVDPVWVWRVPFTPLSMAETVRAIGNLIETGRPTFFITANTHYVMLTHQNPDLQVINARAAIILADGVPLVWASRWIGSPLPERVAGSDLVFELSAEAAKQGYRLFFMGGAEGVAEEAVRRLRELYPGLQVVGTECPLLHELTREEEAALIGRIRAARPHILMVAFGQPKGERWIYQHLEELGVPVSGQIGASLDFAAGRIRRAPGWMRNSGLEWAFRLGLEPRRLFRRYVRNAWFIARMVAWDIRQATTGRRRSPCSSSHAVPHIQDGIEGDSLS
jgi:N-acetylglucosaminyldiphosphoundecaprenol N-acetyl-beta-D-mannosaminyltransferase